MKLSRKKIALLFTSFMTVGLVTTVAVACTNEQEIKKSVTSSDMELESIDSNNFKANNKKEHHLLVTLKNANNKYLQVFLATKNNSDHPTSFISAKALVTNNKADVTFKNLDKNKTFYVTKVMAFDSANSTKGTEISVKETIKKKILKDSSNDQEKNTSLSTKKDLSMKQDGLKENINKLNKQDELVKKEETIKDLNQQKNLEQKEPEKTPLNESAQKDNQKQTPKLEQKLEPELKKESPEIQSKPTEDKKEENTNTKGELEDIKEKNDEPINSKETNPQKDSGKDNEVISNKIDAENSSSTANDQQDQIADKDNTNQKSEQKEELVKQEKPNTEEEKNTQINESKQENNQKEKENHEEVKTEDSNSTHINKDNQPNDGSTIKPSNTSEVQWSSLRVAHWNVLHQNGTNDLKNEALARIILFHKFDVVGLTEIMPSKEGQTKEEKEQAVKKVVDLMNKFSNSTNYDYLISDNLKGKENEKTQTRQHSSTERIGVIYNKEKVIPIPFANGQIGHTYSNPLTFGKWTEKEIDYSRPPFSIKMKSIGKITNDFTLVFAHFDSPDYKKGKKQEKGYPITALRKRNVERILKDIYSNKPNKFVENSQGSRELDDAENIVKVIEEVKRIDQNKDDDYFFLGDTNIKLGNEHFAFKSLREAGFNNLLNDHWDHRTSLSTKTNEMANPYDKIFKNSNLETKNANLFILWKVFESKILNNEWYEKVMKSKNKGISDSEPKERIVRSFISDHSPTWFDLVLNPSDPK